MYNLTVKKTLNRLSVVYIFGTIYKVIFYCRTLKITSIDPEGTIDLEINHQGKKKKKLRFNKEQQDLTEYRQNSVVHLKRLKESKLTTLQKVIPLILLFLFSKVFFQDFFFSTINVFFHFIQIFLHYFVD